MDDSPPNPHLPHRPHSSMPPQSQTFSPAYTFSDGDQFVLFGDSIIQGSFSQHTSFAFAAALADVYARKLDVVNRGFSGYNTLQALRALPLCLPEPETAKIRFLMILFGANDARIAGSPGGPDQYVSLDAFKNNLRHMVDHPSVTAHKDARIILVTTPPIDERNCLKSDQEKYPALGRVLRRTAANTAAYAQAVRDVGKALQLPVLDIHTAMLVRGGHPLTTPTPTPSNLDPQPTPGSLDLPLNPTLQSYLEDGLHFSGEGYRLLFGELMALIERTWPDQMPARLPMKLPAWDSQPAWTVDGEREPGAWENGEGSVVVTGRFEGLLSDVRRVG